MPRRAAALALTALALLAIAAIACGSEERQPEARYDPDGYARSACYRFDVDSYPDAETYGDLADDFAENLDWLRRMVPPDGFVEYHHARLAGFAVGADVLDEFPRDQPINNTDLRAALGIAISAEAGVLDRMIRAVDDLSDDARRVLSRHSCALDSLSW